MVFTLLLFTVILFAFIFGTILAPQGTVNSLLNLFCYFILFQIPQNKLHHHNRPLL